MDYADPQEKVTLSTVTQCQQINSQLLADSSVLQILLDAEQLTVTGQPSAFDGFSKMAVIASKCAGNSDNRAWALTSNCFGWPVFSSWHGRHFHESMQCFVVALQRLFTLTSVIKNPDRCLLRGHILELLVFKQDEFITFLAPRSGTL